MIKNILIEDLKLAILDFKKDTNKTVAAEVLMNAENFIVKTLPSSIETPEVCIEEDGDICFDWLNEKDKVLSISIGSSSKIPYALINGENKSHGVFSNELPEEILAYFRNI